MATANRQPGDTQAPPRFNVLGVGIHAVDLDSAEQVLAAAIAEPHHRFVAVTGVHGVSVAQTDAEFRRILNNAFLCTPDGMPLVWLGRHLGHPQTGRVYGPDLMLRLCDHGRAHGWRHFLLGGRPGVAQHLARRLETLFPGIRIAGWFTPPFRPLTAPETSELTLRLRACAPHIVWVGMSTPKQERFMADHLARFPVPLMIGVGAAFDIHAGLLPQAPRWMQRSGLEWFFRLCVEPRRLWRRYAVNNPLFIARILMQLTGRRRYAIDPPEPDRPAPPGPGAPQGS